MNQIEDAAKAEAAKEGSNGVEDLLGGCRLQYDIINVTTKSATGEDFQMSTLVAWPQFGFTEHRADHAVLGCHITITDDEERPGNYKKISIATDVYLIVSTWAATAFANNPECLVIMPDYEGYGSTKDRKHPYLIRDVQATQCVDAVAQACSWYVKKHKGFVNGWKISSLGYSQGGAVSAASFRKCLETPEYRKLLPNWTGAVCGDGPYDAYATVKYYCDNDRVNMPVAPLLVLKGLCEFDEEMKAAGCKLSDFMSEAYLAAGVADMIDAKTYKTDDCDKKAFDLAKSEGKMEMTDDGKLKAHSVLTQAAFDYFASNGQIVPADPTVAKKFKLLEHCLKKHSLFYKDDGSVWTPPTGAKFTFFHSKGDAVVPFANMESVMNVWGKDCPQAQFIGYDNRKTYTHVDVGTEFFLFQHKELVNQALGVSTWKSGYHEKN